MLKNDIYGKPLSNDFNSAISSYSQVVKPKITIDLLDSRHVENLVITNSDDHTINSKGSIGYYFTNNQLMNGYERESFTWAISDAKEKDGEVIKADGRWHVAPASLQDDYEFGWWSKTKSQSDGVFETPIVIGMSFTTRKVNKVRVVTSESLGQVKTFRIVVQCPALVVILDKTITLNDDEYYKDIYLKSENAKNVNFNTCKVTITIISTKNGEDCARIHEVSPIYEVDITDYVIDYSISRSRDVHESSLPIGGTQSPKVTIKLDNTGKEWNIFNDASQYGKYIKKDLKINVSTGWRIKKTNNILSNTTLKSNISNSATSMSVFDTSIFPDDNAYTNFILTIDPEKENREIVLCDSVTDDVTVSMSQRGYSDSEASSHLAGAVVQFDPYEYVHMGTYYADEWSSSTSDMTVTIQASDFSKFLSEKNLTDGFLVENKAVGDAVLNLLMRSNFPKNDFKQIVAYSKDQVNLGGVARYSFSEDAIDKNGAAVSLENGLRARFWGMRSDREFEYKTIKADVLEKSLSIEDRIQGMKSYSTPDNTELTTTSSKNYTGKALDYTDYSFTSVLSSETFTKYFNGVIDGYYIPLYNGNQDLMLRVTNGGARVYLDDVLIARTLKDATSSTDCSAYTFRGNNGLNLTAGVPYRLRIEFWHGFNETPNFSISLYKNDLVNAYVLVEASEVRTTTARDGLGGRNSLVTLSSYDKANIELSHHQNDGFLSSNVQLSYAESLTTEENNRGILLIDNGYVRIPNHSSIAIGEKDFSIEMIAKFYDGSFSSIDPVYAIGDIGPGGGRIFITPDTVGNTTGKYFEVVPLSAEVKRRWADVAYESTSVTGANGTAIGTGYQNTLDIIAQGNTPANSAAAYAGALTFGGYSDWFLPSKDELNQIFINRVALGNNFNSSPYTVYWNSTEYSGEPPYSMYASAQYLINGGQFFDYKSIVYGVRAVRSFTLSTAGIDGEYLSTWANSNPSNGYEFYYNGPSSHGFKVKTSSSVSYVESSSELLADGFSHIVASYEKEGKKLKYYLNGVLEDEKILTGNVIAQTGDITIGGRNAFFTTNVGESGIPVGRNLIFDEFAIYNKCLTADQILNRYISAQTQTPTVFPFLYSGIGHVREAIDAITLGDLGRFYIDEENFARYESYNRFFEPSIDQHSNIQYTIDDSSNIISSSFNAQLQTNKVIVKVSSIASVDSGTQPLWSAPSPTTLAVVTLTSDILAEDTLIPVSTTVDPVFSNTGYLALSKTVDSEVKTEIIKYLSKTETSFLGVERAKFDTTALSFDAETKVREARYYEINYDKAPAVSVNQPFVIGINDEDPDLMNVLKFENTSYAAKLVISASDNNGDGAIVYAQGKDPITDKEYFTSISGVPVMIMPNNEQITEQVESLQENIRKYGLKELTIESPYVTSIEHATKLGKFIIEKMSDPVPIINIEIMSVPTLQLGDRIKIGSLDSFDIIDGEYWVISQEFSYGESITHSLTLRKVI